MKGPLSIIIVVIAAVLITVAAVNYFEFGQPATTESPPSPSQEVKPAAEPPVPPSGSEPVTEETPETPETIEKGIENLMEAVTDVCAGGEAKEVTLVFSEIEANALAAEGIVQVGIPEDIPLEIKDIHVDFQPGNIVLTEIDTVALGSLQAKVKVKSEVDITDGKPAATVTEIDFGFIPLPDSLKDRVADLVREGIEDLLNQLTETGLGCDGEVALAYKDIDIQEEEATITVLVQPKG